VQGTSSLACARQVQNKAGEGLAGLRQQFECTQLQFLESARTASSVVGVPAFTDQMGFLKSTRDFKGPSAAKEHTNEVRGDCRDPGVRRPGAGFSQSSARSKFFRAAMHTLFSCSILFVIPEGPEDLSGNSFLIWVVSSSRVKGSMKRGWVFGVAVDAFACTEVWREEISVVSFSSYGESLCLKRW